MASTSSFSLSYQPSLITRRSAARKSFLYSMTRLRFRQPRSMHFRSPPESDFDLISTDDVTTPSFSDFYFVDENPFEIQENDCPDNLVFGQDPNWKDTIPLVGPKPFDMGDPGLTYSKINWTGQHTDIRMIMDEDRIDF